MSDIHSYKGCWIGSYLPFLASLVEAGVGERPPGGQANWLSGADVELSW